MSELKLCPFCDGESVSIRMVRLNRRSGYRASCNGCGITQGGIVHPSIEAAKEAWNRRAKPEQPANKESLTTAEPVASPAGYFCEPYLNKPGLFEQVFNGFDDPDVIPLYRDPNGRIAALEREVEALRSLLSDVTCVAITMLYDTHKQDVLDEFTMADLKEVVRRSEHLQIEKVEHIYRRGFEALAAGEAE